MLFRLYKVDEDYHLLLTDGTYRIFGRKDAYYAISHYDELLENKAHQTEFPGFFDGYEGELIASLEANGSLSIHNAESLRSLISFKSDNLNYISLKEYSDKFDKSITVMRKLCLADRIPGAIKISGRWLVPEDAALPGRLAWGTNRINSKQDTEPKDLET